MTMTSLPEDFFTEKEVMLAKWSLGAAEVIKLLEAIQSGFARQAALQQPAASSTRTIGMFGGSVAKARISQWRSMDQLVVASRKKLSVIAIVPAVLNCVACSATLDAELTQFDTTIAEQITGGSCGTQLNNLMQISSLLCDE